ARPAGARRAHRADARPGRLHRRGGTVPLRFRAQRVLRPVRQPQFVPRAARAEHTGRGVPMDAAHGSTAIAVTALSRGIREYSLYQAVRLVLERLRDQHLELDEESLYQRLEFQANPSLGFPGADIEQVRFFHEQGGLRARLQVNLPGLFGSGSPLPAFYAEQALGDDNPTRDFLDLFNERLYRLLLPIWEKYRYHARFRPGASDPFSARLFALIGLGGETLRASAELNWKRLLPYLGLLSLRAHSAALIESVLRYYFKHPAVHIEQCLERRVGILAEQQNQ